MSLRASARVGPTFSGYLIVPCISHVGASFRLSYLSSPLSSLRLAIVALRPSLLLSVVVCSHRGYAATRPTVIRLTSYHCYIHTCTGRLGIAHARNVNVGTGIGERESKRAWGSREEESRILFCLRKDEGYLPIAAATAILLVQQIAKGSWFTARVIRSPRGPPRCGWPSTNFLTLGR